MFNNNRMPLVVFGAALALVAAASAQDSSKPSDAKRDSLGALPIWDDGYAEMCYYDAVTPIYGKPRHYTRVQIVVREWLDPASGVKTDKIDAANAIPVLKLNIAEQIPTENYQYRYMRTLLADRYTLAPRKLTAASEEWCGISFKHLRWRDDACTYQSFSYFEGEADQTWQVPAAVVPFEALLLAAREMEPGKQRRFDSVLPAMRSNRQVAPETASVRLQAAPTTTSVSVPAGRFTARVVTGKAGGHELRMWIEDAAPHRMLKYEFGSESGELRFSERRAYWDRNWGSGAYKQGHAP